MATLRRLIDAGAALDHTDRQGSSALVLAAYFGWAEAVRVLLDSGADPTLRDHHGKDARVNAEDRGHPEVAALLPASPEGGARAGGGRAGGGGWWWRLGWLRTKPVLVDEPGELVVRTFDGFVLRVMGLGVLTVSLLIGAATVSLSGLAHGAATGVFMLAFNWAIAWLGSRQAVRVSGTSLQTRFPLRWKPAVDLREVAAAHYIPRMRAWPALQLLQADRGSLRPLGVQRWQGMEPKPAGPGGEALRCLMVPLGPAYGRVLNRIAPILHDHGTLLDPSTGARWARTCGRTHRPALHSDSAPMGVTALIVTDLDRSSSRSAPATKSSASPSSATLYCFGHGGDQDRSCTRERAGRPAGHR